MLGNGVNALLFGALAIFDAYVWLFKVLLPLLTRW